jgi:hypothetical protein
MGLEKPRDLAVGLVVMLQVAAPILIVIAIFAVAQSCGMRFP